MLEYGVEKKALVRNLSEEELNQVLGELVAQSGKVNTTV